MLDKKIYDSFDDNAWCPGCGNFGIINSLKGALAELELKPEDVILVSGIGQAAKTPHYVNSNVFNGLHGRSLPPAFGAKIANKDMEVIVTSGDGDMYGEGGNHLIHNIRRNIDITCFVHNNQIYGLTKGQGSPTTEVCQVTSLQPDGVRVSAFNPISFAVSQNIGFVGRSFSGDPEHLKEMMKQAINHKGFALLDILQPCVSFNKVNTAKWYKDRIYKLDEHHDPTDIEAAFKKSLEFGDDGIPLGVIYKNPSRNSYLENHDEFEPLVNREWNPMDAEKFLSDFK